MNSHNHIADGMLTLCGKVLSIVLLAASLLIVVSCSTTSALEEDEMLYTGIKKINVNGTKGTDAEELAMAEVYAALDYAPNGALMGSSTLRSPFQIGLWTYNAMVNKPQTGFNRWLFNSFATTPITISHVAPDTRAKVASNLLQNYGYFRGKVDYTLVDQKNPKKQKIQYDVNLGDPYLYDSIVYAFKDKVQDSLIVATSNEANLRKGGQFSTLDLANEKSRIANLFHNNGYYYYRPDYISYFADSTNVPYRVRLLVTPDLDTPENANKQFYFGNINVYMRQSRTSTYGTQRRMSGRENLYDDSISFPAYGLKIAYQGARVPIKPRVMLKNFNFWKKRLFSQERVDRTITNIYNMDMFSGVRFSFTPRDTLGLCDTLDVRLDLQMDKLVSAEVDFSVTQKSNSQVGPNLGLIFSKRNAFHHGETLSVGLVGSYEWETQKRDGNDKYIDSYEIGLNASLSYPWVAFPWLNKKIYRYPTSTEFKVGVDQLNRANYYRLMSFAVDAKYSFQTSKSWSHELSPLAVSYNKMQERTARFDSIVASNSALFVSLRDQFIPAMQYSIFYNNSWNSHVKHTMFFEGTVKESGNLLNSVNSLLGFGFYTKDKKLLYTHYSQFLKFNFQLKNTFKLSESSELATRVLVGGVWSYGNSTYAPYSELFYVGGANSVRAFAVRSIGPGSYRDVTGRGTYLDQAGDMRFEMNAEYRFPILKEFKGALFVDAGNVWLMREDTEHPGGALTMRSFFKDLAVGTGLGLRYDLDFLILRFDLGVGIHAPYDTGKKGYYNIRKFYDGLGFHFAVGYPF